MKRKKIKKAVSCLLLATAMTVSVFPQSGINVYAAENQLPTKEQFATVDELKKFNTDDRITDGGDGKNPARVYFGNNNQQWWIAGSQNGNVTLFAASPLAEKHQKFEPNYSQNKTYDSSWGCTYPNGVPSEVYSNHYGASYIRNTTLKGLETDYFSEAEQALMSDTEVTTNDTLNEDNYSTTDKLYLAYGTQSQKYITVGSGLNNGLRVDMDYWGSQNEGFWLRTPHSYRYTRDVALFADPGNFVDFNIVVNGYKLVPAFELNLSNVSFASAAPAASSGGNLEVQDVVGKDIGNYGKVILRGAFTLRYRTDNLGSAEVSFDKSKVTLTGVPKDKDVYLVVQNSAGAKAKQVTDQTTSVSASDMRLDSFANCKVWLETTDTEQRMTYATLAEEVEKYLVNVSAGKGLNITSENGKQDAVFGSPIEEITVEVADGYYLPDGYLDRVQAMEGWNGLKVTPDEDGNGFRISGKPQTNVIITLPPAAAFQKADTPAVEVEKVTSTSIKVNVTNHKEEFGKIEYKWGDGNWEENKSAVSGLTSDTLYDLAVRFTGNEIYQMSDEAVLKITTMKEGDVTVPTGLKTTYREGLKLSDVDLSSTGWTWADADTALTVGTDKHPAYFDTSELESTHDFSSVEGYDKDNHRVEREIQVTVEKGTSTVTITTETLNEIYEGDAVSAPEYTTSGSKGKKVITWQENKGTADVPKWEPINSAPSEVGNYRVVVTLMEDSNYKSAEAMLEFVISKAENVWTEELSIEGWTYGNYDETKNAPSAEAKFGDVVFTYSDKEDGTYTSKMPENAGTWYVKAVVAGTENYTGLEAVQEFVIKKAIPTPDKDDTPDKGNTSDQNVTDKDNTDTNKSVQTGDRTNILLWVMLLGVSSVGLLCGLYRKKR